MPLHFHINVPVQGKISATQVDNLGFLSSPFDKIDRNTSIFFPFMRTCHSIGDWGVISRLPEILKKFYPNSSFYIPTSECINDFFKDNFQQGNWKESNKYPELVAEWIFNNNPFIDGKFSTKEVTGEIFSDHHRILNNKINEPLVEKIAKFFGVTEEYLNNISTTPKLYFTEEEINKAKSITGENYGCLLLGSRIPQYNNQWEFDHHLKLYAEKYKNIPVFYYSSFDLSNTWWNDYFPNKTSFTDLNLSFREQLCIKSLAKFNLGYQSGITDSISGNCNEVITLTPYNEQKLGSNIIRNVTYIFQDGTKKIY